jgi:hypothetical protein
LVAQGVDFAAVEELVVFEHAEDSVQEFAYGGDEGRSVIF